MTIYVALLRAVNVGGTGKLRMADLVAMCRDAGFARVETYIASGNVVLESDRSATDVKLELETRLQDHFGKPAPVFVRTDSEMATILEANPFPAAPRNQIVAIFLDQPPPADALDHVKGVKDERMLVGAREIYVHYPSGMGRSKLKIAAAAAGTARSLNTVAKLVEMASKMSDTP